MAEPTPPAEEKVNKISTKAAGIVGIAVMCSRVLGLIREQVFAWLFGGGKEMDAFTVAFRTPNLLRDLFAEGALSTAFVTTFSKKIAAEGEGAAWKLANKVATLASIFMSVVVVLGILPRGPRSPSGSVPRPACLSSSSSTTRATTTASSTTRSRSPR